MKKEDKQKLKQKIANYNPNDYILGNFYIVKIFPWSDNRFKFGFSRDIDKDLILYRDIVPDLDLIRCYNMVCSNEIFILDRIKSLRGVNFIYNGVADIYDFKHVMWYINNVFNAVDMTKPQALDQDFFRKLSLVVNTVKS